MIADIMLPNRKTVFFHVMKTGGMTFRNILKALYGDSFHLADDPSIEGIKRELARFDCLEFHVMPRRDQWIYPHSKLVRERRWDLLRGREVFTMLRDPVDRYVSAYYYLVKIRAEVEPIMNANGFAFPESILAFAAFNEQLGFLTGKFSSREALIDRNDLELAKEMFVALRMHVGLMERFADSLNVFETVTGLKVPANAIQVQNQNSSRPPLSALSPYVLESIRERHKLDIEFYEFGRELFLEDISHRSPTREYSFIRTRDEPPAAAVAAGSGSQDAAGASAATARTVFFHALGTNGMTYRRHLTQMYGAAFHLFDDPSVEAIEARLKAFDCVEFCSLRYGNDFVHMHTEIARQGRWDLLEGNHVFTMLRNPMEYLVHRYFLIAKLRVFLEPVYTANGLLFPESLEEFLDRDESRDNQLAFLVGKHPLIAATAPGRADLDEIKAVLLRLGMHIGLTERFADSLRVTAAVTGRQLPADVPNLDPKSDCPPLETFPARIKDRIREQCALDIELYEFGRELFLADFARCGVERAPLY